jgi:hypothetical protein
MNKQISTPEFFLSKFDELSSTGYEIIEKFGPNPKVINILQYLDFSTAVNLVSWLKIIERYYHSEYGAAVDAFMELELKKTLIQFQRFDILIDDEYELISTGLKSAKINVLSNCELSDRFVVARQAKMLEESASEYFKLLMSQHKEERLPDPIDDYNSTVMAFDRLRCQYEDRWFFNELKKNNRLGAIKF